MSSSTLRAILFFFVVSSWTPIVAAQGQVRIVGPGGFSQIQAAIDIASDGDTILVRIPTGGSPIYKTITVTGKALTILADSSTLPARVEGVKVQAIPAGKTVLLSRLDATGGSLFVPSIQASSITGHLRLLSCSSIGKDGTPNAHHPEPMPAMGITGSSGSTAMTACELTGGVGGYGGSGDYYYGSPGGSALEMTGSKAAAFDSTLTGGPGGPGCDILFESVAPGGPGASLAGAPSRLLLSNSALQGGRGGTFVCTGYGYPGGRGGAGLELGPAGTSAVQHATTITGGPGGTSCDGPTGPSGQAVVLNSGTLTVNSTAPLRLRAPTVVREGAPITLDFTGTPGDKVTLILGHDTSFREKFGGVLMVSAPNVRYFMGTIGASGTLSASSTVPLLSGVEASNVWLQALAIHADTTITLSNFAVVTVLASYL